MPQTSLSAKEASFSIKVFKRFAVTEISDEIHQMSTKKRETTMKVDTFCHHESNAWLWIGWGASSMRSLPNTAKSIWHERSMKECKKGWLCVLNMLKIGSGFVQPSVYGTRRLQATQPSGNSLILRGFTILNVGSYQPIRFVCISLFLFMQLAI